MKKKIGDIIKKPSKETMRILKKALKKEIRKLDYLGKCPPRYYAYKMMIKYIRDLIIWRQIFNEDILREEIEVENNANNKWNI